MEDLEKEIVNSKSIFWSILVYIVGIIINAYWGIDAFYELFGIFDDFTLVPISVSLIFSFLALRNYRNLKRINFKIFFISASILHYFLSFIFWLWLSLPWGG